MPTNHYLNNPGICLCDDQDEVNNVVIDIAVITEELPTVTRDSSVTKYLAPIDITYNEFHNLFYFNNGKFTPNTTLGCSSRYKSYISHSGKQILHASGKSKGYHLLEELTEHYQKHLEDPPDCWDPCTRIEFERKVSNIKSLFDVGVCNITCSLSLDEFFDAIQANGVEINSNTGMPSLYGQKQKVIALVTLKFVSNNIASELDKGVPDLNITWPFRINFSANVQSSFGHGCGDCKQFADHTHTAYVHDANDHDCETYPYTSHSHPEHEARTLCDLYHACKNDASGSCITIKKFDSDKNSGEFKKCPCIQRLDITDFKEKHENVTIDKVLSPWPCTDWCDGDRYRTSYDMAKWKLVCCSDVDSSCNASIGDQAVPGENNLWRWHQICDNCNDHHCREHQCNTVVKCNNSGHTHKKSSCTSCGS